MIPYRRSFSVTTWGAFLQGRITHCHMSTMTVALIKGARVWNGGVRAGEVVSDKVKASNDLETRADSATENGMSEINTSVEAVANESRYVLVS